MALQLFVWTGTIIIIRMENRIFFSRICGQVFNSVTTNNPAAGNVPVYSYAKPFHIYVHTDSVEGSSSPPESLNRGFCLNFVQQPCTSSTG